MKKKKKKQNGIQSIYLLQAPNLSTIKPVQAIDSRRSKGQNKNRDRNRESVGKIQVSVNKKKAFFEHQANIKERNRQIQARNGGNFSNQRKDTLLELAFSCHGIAPEISTEKPWFFFLQLGKPLLEIETAYLQENRLRFADDETAFSRKPLPKRSNTALEDWRKTSREAERERR